MSVEGRIAPLLQLGAGFDPDLPVVDNIVLYGVLLGMDRRTIESRIDAILKFAELEEYRNYPVHALSSGMMARLGFGVATDADADVLLIDEALSVGDSGFRQNRSARIDALWHQERTVILVSHDLVTDPVHLRTRDLVGPRKNRGGRQTRGNLRTVPTSSRPGCPRGPLEGVRNMQKTLVFIAGAEGSGTTMLQRLLGAPACSATAGTSFRTCRTIRRPPHSSTK